MNYNPHFVEMSFEVWVAIIVLAGLYAMMLAPVLFGEDDD